MKTIIFLLGIFFFCLIGCQSIIQKVGANSSLSEEWLIFKQAAEIQIRNNEVHIADLKEQNIFLGEDIDAIYQKKIGEVAQKNKEIRDKIEAYQIEKKNLPLFKKQIKTDMEILGKTLNELTLNYQQNN